MEKSGSTTMTSLEGETLLKGLTGKWVRNHCMVDEKRKRSKSINDGNIHMGI